MRKSRVLLLTGTSVCLLLLILDGQTALRGMQEGIDLCISSLIPALFPYSVLTCMITGSILGAKIQLLSPICKICTIPSGCESLFAVGILGGYPMGAQSVASAYKNKQLTKDCAQRMAIICNNSGPSFIFGILSRAFPSFGQRFALWAIQIVSAMIVGYCMPTGRATTSIQRTPAPVSLTAAIRTAVKSMAGICGCVMLFRTVLEYLERWFLRFLPPFAKVAVSGILELSNGCLMLQQIPTEQIRIITASGLLSFGGLCVWMQTLSVCSGLEVPGYLKWKSIQSIIAISLAALFSVINTLTHSGTLLVLLSIVPIILITVLIKKKSVAF